MTYDPRTIAYITELVHFPMQHEAQSLRRLYNELGERAAEWYINFNMDPAQGGAQLVTARQLSDQQQQISAVTVMPDRMQIQEEMTDLTLESYIERMTAVAESATDNLGIQQLNAQQCIVRSLVSPRSTRDAREFLGNHMCGFTEEQLSTMERPMGMVGLRFMFPQDDEDASVFNVRLESYNADVRSVFLEVAGVFPGVVEPTDLGTLTANFNRTYAFMRDNLCDFVSRFDGNN